MMFVMWIRLTTAGVLAFSVCLPAANVTAAVLAGTRGSTLAVYAVATALYLPPLVVLVWSRGRGRQPWHGYWLLAAMAVVVVGAVPWAGPWWSRSFAALALAVLVVVPAPWSLLAYAVLWLAPVPVCLWWGAPRLWIWGVLAVNAVLGPYVLLRLSESVRRLEATRRRLAAESVARERLRIDDEVREVVGTELVAIAEQADRAVASMGDPVAARLAIERIVGGARATSAGARTLIRGYRRRSWRSAVDSAVGVLDAAGIRVRVVLPAEPLGAAAEERVLAAVRAAVARLVSADAGDYVLTVSASGVEVGTAGPVDAR